MKRLYFITVITIVFSLSLALHLLFVGAGGSDTPGFFARMRNAWRGAAGWLRHSIDGWTAAMLARRERQATIYALRNLSDRELRDIGVHRDHPAFIDRRSEARHRPTGGTRAFAVQGEDPA